MVVLGLILLLLGLFISGAGILKTIGIILIVVLGVGTDAIPYHSPFS